MNIKDIRNWLMTGVSYMIPFVTAGGICIALSFVVGGYEGFQVVGSISAHLMTIGQTAFGLMVPILAGFIAFGMADRPGIAPGVIAGMIANSMGAGFLGGLVGGLLAGFVVYWIKQIKVPKLFQGLMPVLIIPLIATLIVGLLMIVFIGNPIKSAMDGLSTWLNSLSGVSAGILGVILGMMMAFDMGGPVGKVAYTFGLAMIASGIYAPQAANMAAGMAPPLGMALATYLRPKKYTLNERESAKAAIVLGLSFISEGAIPFAVADPLRVIPSLMVGSAVTGAMSMIFGCTLRAPHGGIFVLPLIEKPLLFLLSLAVGVVVTALMVNLLKPIRPNEDLKE